MEITALVSALAIVVAVISAMISYLSYTAQVHPEVVVYTDVDPKIPSMIYLVVENTGKSPARDVTFVSSEKIPTFAFGLTPEDAKRWPRRWLEHGPLVTGIPFLASGGKRRIVFGQYPGLYAILGDRSIRIRARYRSRQNDILDWQEHQTESVVDVRSYESTDAGDNDPICKIARHLEEIKDELRSMRNDKTA